LDVHFLFFCVEHFWGLEHFGITGS
jgi:hypothetical protein